MTGSDQATAYVLPVTCLWKVREIIVPPSGSAGGKTEEFFRFRLKDTWVLAGGSHEAFEIR